MNKLALWAILLAGVALALHSCRVEKRLHRPGYHVEWVKKKSAPQASESNSKPDAQFFQSEENQDHVPEFAEASNQTNPFEIFLEGVQNDLQLALGFSPEGLHRLQISADKKRELNNSESIRQCETLVMTDGRRILIFVVEIGEEKIRYKRCDDAQGKVYSVFRKDVNRIEYPDGNYQVIKSPEKIESELNNDQEAPKKELETLAVGAFSISLLLFLGWVSIWLALISLRRFRAQPGRFRGIGFAIAGLVIGIVTTALLVALIAVSL